MSKPQKLLLLDDDQDLLELYREILRQLPSQPEIHTATSGARAIALLESEPFTLLISDLNMPKMDGLQVLTIVRRKFPYLRTAVMTAVADEQFRARAYGMGIDLFLEKPNTNQELRFFLDCIESLLGRQQEDGFRGVQSKSLVDIIQLECLSQGSSVLKITNGVSEGRVWIQDGEVVDAACQDWGGETAFQKIMAWKTGNFEILPPERSRTRTIFNSYHGLLLETAQALDEAGARSAAMRTESVGAAADYESPLAELARFQGVEFVVSLAPDGKNAAQAWGAENPAEVAAWVRKVRTGFEELGEVMKAGPLRRVEGYGPHRQVALQLREEATLCVGFHRSCTVQDVRKTMRGILAKWVS